MDACVFHGGDQIVIKGNWKVVGIVAGATVLSVAQFSQAARFNVGVQANLTLSAIFQIDSNNFPVTPPTAIPADLVINGLADFSVQTLNPTGNATGDISSSSVNGPGGAFDYDITNPANPVMGSINLINSLQGEALQPPDSSVSANVSTFGRVDLQNTGGTGSTYIIVFDLTYTGSLSVSESGNPFTDQAQGTTQLMVDTDEGGNEFTFLTEISTEDGGPITAFPNRSETFAIVLRPGDTDGVDLIFSSTGFAQSLVPEPVTATMIGLMGLGLLSRRRRTN